MWLLTTLIILGISSVFKAFASHDIGTKQLRRCYDSRDEWKEYNEDTHVCCKHTVHRKRTDAVFKCCGSSMYESSTGYCCSGEWILHTESKQCCNNRVYDVQNGMSCCGKPWTAGNWMNTMTHSCCYNDMNGFTVRQGQGQCCGVDKLYQPNSQKCCERGHESQVHDVHVGHTHANEWNCCGLDVYRTDTHQCCKYRQHFTIQPLSDFIQCCGMTHYDIRTQVCCKGVPQSKGGGKTSCCGEISYNRAQETCCALELFPIGHGSCCNKKAYSKTTSSCCRIESSYPYRASLNSSIPEIAGVQACCGTTSYLINHHVCCDGQLHERTPGKLCCGSELYDPESQLCCNQRTILPKHTNLTQCCSDVSFESNTQTCCSGNVANITNGMCCYRQPYDPKTTTCCEGRYGYTGQTYPGADQKHKCCGTNLFNHDTQICADGLYREPVVFNKSPDHLDHDKVCLEPWTSNFYTYNSKLQACVSDGTLQPKRQGEQFCGGNLYHPDNKICCTGFRHQRYTSEGEERMCCGISIRSFTPSTQSCFINKVFDGIPQDHASFCGGFAYNNQTHFCYKDLVERPIEDSHLVLCGDNKWEPSAWYNPHQFKCHQDTGTILASDETLCNGVIFHTPGVGLGYGKCCQGAVAYNPTTQLCCGLQVYNISEETKCCGNEIFNELNPAELCCRDNLWSTSGERTVCTGDIAHRPDQAVCGTSVYNSLTQMCCNGIVHSKHHNSKCCGKLSFNTLDPTQLCCEDTLHSNPSHEECCGNQLNDPTTRTCQTIAGQNASLPNQLAQSTFCTTGIYDPSQHTCCSGILHQSQGVCCGFDLITDHSIQICCGGTIHQKDASQVCCNGGLYHRSEYTCCGNKPLSQLSLSQDCCNDSIYNTYEQQCSNGTILSQTKDNNHEPTREPHITTTTRHYSTPTVGLECDGVLYDYRTSGCCSGQVYNLFNRKCDGERVVRNKCEVCQLRNKSRRQNLKQVCSGKNIRLVRITAKEVDNTKNLITLTAEDIDVVKDLLEPSQGGIDVIQVKIPKACQCNKITRHNNGTGTYMIITDSLVEDDNTLWLRPGDALTRANGANLGKFVRRMLTRCDNQEALYGGTS